MSIVYAVTTYFASDEPWGERFTNPYSPLFRANGSSSAVQVAPSAHAAAHITASPVIAAANAQGLNACWQQHQCAALGGLLSLQWAADQSAHTPGSALLAWASGKQYQGATLLSSTLFTALMFLLNLLWAYNVSIRA